ncbi:MAG: single-stranded-DNA-specific exonuclease RecJ [Oscillospiraceae bacterium]|nr:single-stranded-DNA-specific exonuclease RecJ [Oscillospiraceae bacterium]
MKKWTYGKPDPAVVADMARQSDLSELCCTVLAAQDCITLRQAAERIGCTALSDPFLICDMQEAADAVNAAVDEGRRICIYGDYDCDGVMATVILYSFLSEIGADVIWRIPERSEGYGLNEAAVREMHEAGVSLVLTVDNGISAVREAALIKELGMELVITDHHQPGPTLPEALAVVDPHREDNFSPYRLYCGAGIALLLVAALNEGDTAMAMEQAGDLAAIATVADVVSLTGENRYLVEIGLQYLENTERPGLRALRSVSGLDEKPMTSGNVAFMIAPRINAAGRLASPKLAVELLLAEDPDEAEELAKQLNSINAERKACEEEIMHAIRGQIDADPDRLHDRVLVFAGEDWHAGVIGIVAARVMERWGKPSIMISIKDGIGHGSARSFGDFSVFGCLTACEELLEKFGGHPAAGGFTIKAENIPAFREKIAAYAAEQDMPVPELHAACLLEAKYLLPDTARSLQALEPFGCDNPEPVFMVENASIREIRPLSAGVHTKLTVDVGGVRCDALLFRTAPERTGLKPGDTIHMMVRLSVSAYMGQDSVSLVVQDYRLSGLRQGQIIAAMQTYDAYRRKETLAPAYYRAACPTREECITVYKAVPVGGIDIHQLDLQMYAQQINYCKVRICLDIFAELGLIAVEDCESRAKRLPVSRRTDLQSSRILQELERLAAKQ